MTRLAAAITFLLVLIGATSAAPPPQGDEFKINVAVDLVNVNFSATDSRGRMISGLSAQDFIIEEDGKPQTISIFAREHELPLTLGILIDISPSVRAVFEEEQITACRFLESVLAKRDLATVIAFDRSVILVQDYTDDLPSLTKAIRDLKLSRPGTSLYDAIYLAAAEKLAREAGRKAIVLISDGEDTTSTYNLSKAMIAAHKSDVVIYTISNSGNSSTLRTLAEESGGMFYRFREKGDFEKVFQQIAEELRTQYSIAYHSTNDVHDGSYRKIKIVPKSLTSKFEHDEDTMRRVTRTAAKVLLGLLIILPLGTSAGQVQLRSRVEVVLVPVSATGKNGKLEATLAQSDFTISEDGKKQAITSFSIDPVPISAAILIDTGISEGSLTRVKNSFPVLAGAFADDDELAVYSFDKRVEKLMDFSSDRAQLDRTFEKLLTATPSSSSTAGGPVTPPGPIINGAPIIPGVQSAGRTIAQPTKVLHDAMFQAAEDLSTRTIDRRRIVIVASDGRNQNSQSSFDTALARLLMNEVQVFAFGVDTSMFQRVRSNLLSYTKATGGDSCFGDAQDDLESCYLVSTEEARNQYVLGYVSTNKRPATGTVFREIKVRVDRPRVDIRYKKGYYQTPVKPLRFKNLS